MSARKPTETILEKSMPKKRKSAMTVIVTEKERNAENEKMKRPA